MSKQQVTTLLGTPSIADPFHQERWDYTASQRAGRRAHTEVKNLTAVVRGRRAGEMGGRVLPGTGRGAARQQMRSFGNLPKEKDKRRGQ